MGRLFFGAAVCSMMALGIVGATTSGQSVAPPAGGGGSGAASGDKASMRRDLLELMGDGEASRQQVSEVMTLLEGKRQLVVVALAGKQARVRALQRSMDDIQAEIDKAIRDDDSMIALDKALMSLQQQLEMAQRAGSSPMDVAARLTDVSRQTMLITERREEIRLRTRGGTLLEVMRCQIDADADVKELEGELTSVESQMAKVRGFQSAAIPG